MNAKILIVEDDRDIADIIMRYLKKDGVDPVWLDTGEGALELLESDKFDLLVLDINLPGMDGFETLGKIRKFSQIPVIIVSARQEDVDMILGFGTGADDYVTKPFSPSVLVARIRAHLRRIENGGESDSRDICFGDFALDPVKQVLLREGKTVNLSPREMDLLIFLVTHAGDAYSQEDLYREVWGNDFGDLSTVSVHIRRLRKKLGEVSSDYKYVKSRYGYGYFFNRESIR